MILPTLSVRRPVLAATMNIVLLVIGASSLMRLQVRQYPDVDPPVVSVSTTYRGASAEVIDAEVTKRLVDQLSGIEGIRTIESVSTEERSSIDVEFTLDRDVDLAAADVRDQINRARRSLPDTIDDPVVTKASGDASPMMWISLTSTTLSAIDLTDYASRNLVDPLSIISGVSSIRVGGERRPAIRIWLDRRAMAARAVTADDISQRLVAENVELPAGRIESADREFTVRALSRLRTPQEFAALIIRSDGDSRVRLDDVADIELGAQNDRTDFWVNGKRAISLGIIRQSKANTIEVATAVRAELARLAAGLPPDIDLQIASDDSLFIRASIREVAVSLLIAVGLVVVVILVFLGSFRATIVPSVAIPVSVIAAIVVLYALGYSLNVLTLLAGVLAIGLVVDDAIVVLENIDRRVGLGEPPLLAAVRGASEVGFAVLATTVVLVTVFVPLAFLTGKVGRLFNEFGIALAAAVCFSSFVALTLGAMLSSRVLKLKPRAASGRRPPLAALGSALLRLFDRAVGLCITLRWPMVVGAIAICAGAYSLYQRLPKELTPVEDQGRFFINIEGPEGASLQDTSRHARHIESLVDRFRDGDGPVQRVITIVAPSFGSSQAVNTGRMIVRLHPWDDRDTSQQQIVNALFPQLQAIPGVRSFPVNPPSLGIRGGGQPIQYAIGAPDFPTARQWARTVVEAVRDDPAFLNLRAEIEESKPQLRVEIDRARAATLGITIDQVGRALQTFLGGREITEYLDRGELYEVVMQARPDSRATPRDLTNIYVRAAASGRLIPLSSVVTLTESGTVRDLRRINRSPSVVISGSVAPGSSLGEALDKLDDAVARSLPGEARVNYLGESLEFRDSSAELVLMFVLALVLVYLALAAQFESFIHPVTILIAVPLAITGGLASLLFAGLTLNIFSQIGLILLVGLMTKNGILLVEFANRLREQGLTVPDAARRAAVIRLRPILMTSISTVLGALPLVLASGAGSEGRRAIGVVIVGGVAFSSALTLFLIPALYAILGGLTKPSNSIARRLSQLEQDHGPALVHGGNGHNGTHPEPGPRTPAPAPARSAAQGSKPSPRGSP